MAVAFFSITKNQELDEFLIEIRCWLVNELTAGQETAFCVVSFVFRIISLNRPLFI